MNLSRYEMCQGQNSGIWMQVVMLYEICQDYNENSIALKFVYSSNCDCINRYNGAKSCTYIETWRIGF